MTAEERGGAWGPNIINKGRSCQIFWSPYCIAHYMYCTCIKQDTVRPFFTFNTKYNYIRQIVPGSLGLFSKFKLMLLRAILVLSPSQVVYKNSISI